MPARFALSYVPENGTPLAALGRTWLGRDVYSSETQDQPKIRGIAPDRLAELTKWRRSDGLHSILKPSFHLNSSTSLASLIETVKLLAAKLKPVEIPQLEISVIGKFITLTPTIPSRETVELASQCVRVFDGYRAPIKIDLNARYIRDKLTVYQNRMLKHWGYPYVMEEFQFFVPLTDRIENDGERAKISKALSKLCQPAMACPLSINGITVLGQDSRKDPMSIIERVPFGRT